jgi:type II secretory ATPase GspE/PulE/Tfp pilus assembly ATPase PilB-like protein
VDDLAPYGLGEWVPEHQKLERGAGCDYCEDIGYQGRIGIFEILEVSSGLSQLISQMSPSNKLLTQAKADGMVTMREDGLKKVAAGITTLDEVLKVT